MVPATCQFQFRPFRTPEAQRFTETFDGSSMRKIAGPTFKVGNAAHTQSRARGKHLLGQASG
jgi:hypothetical protein